MKAVTSIDPSILSIHCKSDMILLLHFKSNHSNKQLEKDVCSYQS